MGATSGAHGAGDGPGEDDAFALKNRMTGVGLVRDPHPVLRQLAAECPVHAGSLSGKFGIMGNDNAIYSEDEQMTVFGYLPVEQGYRDPATFSSSYSTKPLGAVIGRTILEMDAPDHGRYRGLIQGAFTKKEMDRWEHGFVRDIIRGFIDGIASRGHGDLAQEVAFHYPITVISTAAGLPVDDVNSFYEQSALLTNPGASEDVRVRASKDLGAMVQTLIDERRADPQDDLISLLTQAKFKAPDDPEHSVLTDGEIVAFMRLLVPAGAQTTYRSLTNLLCALLTHPDQLRALHDDRSLIPQAIEEGLRWEGPLLFFGRIAMQDTEIAGIPIPKGKKVNLCTASANRDPGRWENPDEFDIFRPQLAHMAFGQGPHICLGIHFARMELRVALEEIIDRLPNLRLAPDAVDVHVDGCTSRTALSLPCVWDAPA